MTTIAELNKHGVRLPAGDLAHLQHLLAEWQVLADLAFSDLLLFVTGDRGDSLVVMAHVRPTNSETTYREDPVGVVYSSNERPWVRQTWETGEPTKGELRLGGTGDPIQVNAVPVRLGDRVIGVLSLERWKHMARRYSSPMEEAYSLATSRLAAMVAEGTFPYRSWGPVPPEAIRVGDGLVYVNPNQRIAFASPNATSVLHRLGVYGSIEDRPIEALHMVSTPIREAVVDGGPVSDELQADEVSVLLLALPLRRAGRSEGAIVLVRDISELRQRDRLLLSKEAAIREIHHRVKNNLQTIASLLGLQVRRTRSEEARAALSQSVRRIKSIALVHETLARAGAGLLPFDSILNPLLRNVEEGLVGENRVSFRISGDAGVLPAEVATPLAVVLTELLQNAVEHAFGPERATAGGSEAAGGDDGGSVAIEIDRQGGEMQVAVSDDGPGYPEGFDLDHDAGLGLKIVRTLVESELRGDMTIEVSDAGARTVVRFPLASEQDFDDRLGEDLGGESLKV